MERERREKGEVGEQERERETERSQLANKQTAKYSSVLCDLSFQGSVKGNVIVLS